MISYNAASRLFFLFAFLVMALVPVRAQEEPPVIKALYDTFAEIGGERPSHDTLSIDGDGTITISGLHLVLSNFQQEGEDIRHEMTVAEAVLSGVKELEAGLFEVSSMTLKKVKVSISSPAVSVVGSSMPVMQLSGTIIRSPEHIKTPLDRWMASQLLAREGTVPLLTVNVADWSFDAHDLSYSWNGDPRTGLGEWTYSVGTIVFPDGLAQMAEGPMSLKDLGYEKVRLSLAGKSSVGITNDLISIGFDTTFSFKDMGAFTIEVGLGGIQLGLIETAQAIRESPNSIDVGGLMGQAQTITIGRFKLRYDDASLVDRVFAYLEKKEGKTRDELIGEAVEMSDFGMMGLNTPEFAKQAREALRTFLQKPGWIQFEAKPAQPVAVSQLMQLFGAPSEVVKLLGLSVTAGPPPKAE